jgi:hypothetical protein
VGQVSKIDDLHSHFSDLLVQSKAWLLSKHQESTLIARCRCAVRARAVGGIADGDFSAGIVSSRVGRKKQ